MLSARFRQPEQFLPRVQALVWDFAQALPSSLDESPPGWFVAASWLALRRGDYSAIVRQRFYRDASSAAQHDLENAAQGASAAPAAVRIAVEAKGIHGNSFKALPSRNEMTR